ncbi:Eukaryotic aspartyl protease family protein [Striga hermonthica]|uniref:Eukaryotic aspartyl protease family protein n=1 Tax=Striga hermonthica TaxID=68872 RepID=A0A9N7MIQ3_STRHE|nr:Eukaryotic aspartyl protease family protein [Striga hermonthica]
MAFSSPYFLLIFPLIFLVPASISQNPILPKAAIFPVRKDLSTHQYVSKLFIGEDLGPIELVLDLSGPFIWADCGSISASRSQQPINTCSLKCSMVRPTKGCYSPGHKSRSCTFPAENTLSGASASGEIHEDEIAIEFWAGSGLSSSFAKNERFLFSCAPNLLLKGLANGAKGVFGLGSSRISLPSQFSTSFGFFDRKFSLCLPASSNGAVFLGGSPHGSEISSPMIYTPLVMDKNGVRHGSYYIDVGSIKISGKKLTLPENGFVRTKLSSVVPYTTLERKLYAAFVDAYVKAANEVNLTMVSSVAPFEVCFSSKGVVEIEKPAPNVPIIDLVLQSEMVKWRISSKNSMVFVGDDIMCLGFLDGGINPKDLIVIGGHQMEDYLLEFNLGNSMLGISQLGIGGKRCSDFAASKEVL